MSSSKWAFLFAVMAILTFFIGVMPLLGGLVMLVTEPPASEDETVGMIGAIVICLLITGLLFWFTTHCFKRMRHSNSQGEPVGIQEEETSIEAGQPDKPVSGTASKGNNALRGCLLVVLAMLLLPILVGVLVGIDSEEEPFSEAVDRVCSDEARKGIDLLIQRDDWYRHAGTGGNQYVDRQLAYNRASINCRWLKMFANTQSVDGKEMVARAMEIKYFKVTNISGSCFEVRAYGNNKSKTERFETYSEYAREAEAQNGADGYRVLFEVIGEVCFKENGLIMGDYQTYAEFPKGEMARIARSNGICQQTGRSGGCFINSGAGRWVFSRR